MDIFESLENLNVSEECFEDIVGLVEMYLNELHAPTPETAKAVFDRKAQQLQSNTNKFKDYGNYSNTPMYIKPSEFGKADKQNREYEAYLHTEKNNLRKGAQRLNRWAVNKKAQGELKGATLDSARNMTQKGREHAEVTSGF